jgi:hypothetical protein
MPPGRPASACRPVARRTVGACMSRAAAFSRKKRRRSDDLFCLSCCMFLRCSGCRIVSKVSFGFLLIAT